MIHMIFVLLLMSTKAHASDLTTMRRALGHIESGNDPAAQNPQTTASGKYQFMRAWDGFFKKYAGRSWTSTVPSKKASKQAKAEASAKQDALFDIYHSRVVRPWINRVRGQGLAKNYSDGDLLAMVHRQGERGALKWLKTGHDPFNGRYGNKSLARHITKMRKAMNQSLAQER